MYAMHLDFTTITSSFCDTASTLLALQSAVIATAILSVRLVTFCCFIQTNEDKKI